MPATASTTHPDALLCESCGYPLADPALQPTCPECGAASKGSLPSKRHGSPYQQRVAGRWLRTASAAALSPIKLFSVVQINRATSARLLAINLMVAAACSVAGWLWAAHQWSALALPVWLAGVLGLWLLTWIETLGLRMFGRQRGWRVTPTVAWVVCDHASIGWTLGGVLMLLVWLTDAGGRLAYWPWLNRQAASAGINALSSYEGSFRLVFFAGAFMSGMLIFESLVYVGVRACRFANTPGARPHA